MPRVIFFVAQLTLTCSTGPLYGMYLICAVAVEASAARTNVASAGVVKFMDEVIVRS